MKITLFTSNQPRHINLAQKLSEFSEEVFCIQECNTVFPGLIDDFFKRSEVMKKYFNNVIKAENKIFGGVKFSQHKVRTLSIKSGDLNNIDREQISVALNSDVYIVFGASYIKGWLVDFLIERGAFNIHMGLSPYYRGSSCNFWALYDNNPGYVGATIHMLSKGLDSGPMLFHCIPRLMYNDSPFDFTMRSVEVAHNALCARIKDGSIFDFEKNQQDKSQEVRYSRNKEFSDEVAKEFLERKLNLQSTELRYPKLKEPYFD